MDGTANKVYRNRSCPIIMVNDVGHERKSQPPINESEFLPFSQLIFSSHQQRQPARYSFILDEKNEARRYRSTEQH
jgi:hypothetical protein